MLSREPGSSQTLRNCHTTSNVGSLALPGHQMLLASAWGSSLTPALSCVLYCPVFHCRLVPPPLGSLLPLWPRFQASLSYSCPLNLLSTPHSPSSRASVSLSPRGSWEQTLAPCSGHLYTTHQSFFATESEVVPGTHEDHGERWKPLAFREQAPFHDHTEMNLGLKA